MNGKMTARQARFVEEYLVDNNGTQAAIRAGFSKKTAGAQADRLLKNVEVASAIAKAVMERTERTKIDQDYVVNRLVVEAEFHGEGASHAARVSALSLLGKHLRMFVDRHEHAGADGKPFKVYLGFDANRV